MVNIAFFKDDMKSWIIWIDLNNRCRNLDVKIGWKDSNEMDLNATSNAKKQMHNYKQSLAISLVKIDEKEEPKSNEIL